MYLSHLAVSLQTPSWQKSASCIRKQPTNKQTFLLPHYCGIRDPRTIGLASETQINDSPMDQGHDYRVNCPKVPSERMQQVLRPVCAVWEYTVVLKEHLATNVWVS